MGFLHTKSIVGSTPNKYTKCWKSSQVVSGDYLQVALCGGAAPAAACSVQGLLDLRIELKGP